MLGPDLAEQAVIFERSSAGNAGREVENAQAASLTAIAEYQPPKPFDGQWPAGWLEHRPEIGPGSKVEGIDMSVAEITDQQLIAELAEIRRRHGQAPGRIERSLRGESTDQI